MSSYFWMAGMEIILMKNKLDLSKGLQISERDKIILWIAGAFLLVFLSYFFGCDKIVNKTQIYEQQLITEKAKQKDLAEKNANRQKYETDTNEYTNKFHSILSGYDNGTSQDSMLVFLSNLETITGGWIKSTTFSSLSPIYTFGQNSSSNPGGGKGYTTDMTGYKNTLTMAYEADYDDLKSVVSYINNYYSKNSIDSVTMSYNDVTGAVSGTIAVSNYCITGSDRIFEYPKIDKQIGTNNLFKSLTFKAASTRLDDNGSYILSNYDYYMMVNPSGSDNNSCMIGRKGDEDGDSILATNFNEMQKVSIKFSGSDGQYSASYKIGDKAYPAINYSQGVEFDPGDSMDMLIMSSSRLSDNDKSSVSITVENDSDMNLHIKVCNDDVDKPRVQFEDKEGAVSIYE